MTCAMRNGSMKLKAISLGDDVKLTMRGYCSLRGEVQNALFS
jgi:hypothetical protein